MCIGFWSLGHPDYALILCSNHDGCLSREPRLMHTSTTSGLGGHFVLSGTDPKDPSSAVTARAASIFYRTNISEPEGALYEEFRGYLVSSFLPDAPDADHFVGSLEREGLTNYAGFNLLLTPTSGGESGADEISYEASLITKSRDHGSIIKGVPHPEERRAGVISKSVDTVDRQAWLKAKKAWPVTELLQAINANEQKLSEEEFIFRDSSARETHEDPVHCLPSSWKV